MEPKPPFSSPEKGKGMFMQPNFDESIIDPEILGAVKAIRNSGIETIASHSGIGQTGVGGMWGSYIQIQLLLKINGQEIAKKINEFAHILTLELQQELNNPTLCLELVSAERWHENNNTKSMEISYIPIYRLQLIGYSEDEEIRQAWNKVAQKFNPSVIE